MFKKFQFTRNQIESYVLHLLLGIGLGTVLGYTILGIKKLFGLLLK